MEYLKLDIGCGNTKRKGFLGIDILPLSGVDIVHDLNQFPYPFKDNEIEELWLDQVLEHLENPLKVIDELYRICKPGARVTIGVPYFRSFYATIDPTHRNFFGTFGLIILILIILFQRNTIIAMPDFILIKSNLTRNIRII